MQKIFFVVLIVGIVFFQYCLWFGNGGYTTTATLKRELLNRQSNVDKLRQRNNDLIAKINSIRATKNSLEAKSRYELNMVKPNEILVFLSTTK